MAEAADRLARVMRQPDLLSGLSLREWDRLIPPARQSGLLARLALAVAGGAGLAAMAPPVRDHLLSAQLLAEKHQRDTFYELERVKEALQGVIEPVILLKGAAYLAAGLPPAAGRVFNDIDILVPKEKLPAVEAVLSLAGWHFGEIDPYDMSYYRRWMHQIPPLGHFTRQSALDVHHTIVAVTRRNRLDAKTLFGRSMPLAERPGFAVLAPTDMVLHSAAHLFDEGEFARGLRDLDDMSQLLRHFGRDPEFFTALVERAAELDLRRPLFYALRYTAAFLGAAVPRSIAAADRLNPPGVLLRALMDFLFDRALRPDHPDCRDLFSGAALRLLYTRAHWLRMPPHILVPHLIRKAYMRRTAKDE